MNKRIVTMDIKEISEEGSFEGLLSPYRNVDETGDVVDPGAYTKTLKEQNNEVVCLWQHDTRTPIGKLMLEDRPEGLWCKGQLLMSLPRAQEAYHCIKGGLVRGLSIGFTSVKDSIENGIRHLKEIKLYEGSLVTFPANLRALIAAVKSRGESKGDFSEELTSVQLQDAGDQMFRALYRALSSLPWMRISPEDKLKAAQAMLQQFTDAYLAYLPAYVAYLEQEYGSMETMDADRALEVKTSFEFKAGAQFSSANKSTINSHADTLDNVSKSLKALVSDEAEQDATSKAKPVAVITSPEQAATKQPEPVEDHSALLTSLKKWESAISAH